MYARSRAQEQRCKECMTSDALLFTLSALGISETVYLIKTRFLSQKPVCVVGEDCLKVLESKYSKIFIIPNDVLGLLFYIASSFIAAFLVIEIAPLQFWVQAITILVALGSVISVFFVYLQFKVIKAWCFWCLMSAGTIWLMGIILLFKNAIK